MVAQAGMEIVRESVHVGYATDFSWSVGEKKKRGQKGKGGTQWSGTATIARLFGSELLVSMLVSDG
jgi:hypothetical protein